MTHDDLATTVELQRVTIEAQQRAIEALEQRLHALEQQQADTTRSDGSETSAVSGDEVTDRRKLLGRAGALAAGAIAGGAAMVVAEASPAAAASGTFDGNPAVSATANSGGTGVYAKTTQGYGVYGSADGGVGVLGIGVKDSATGVAGQAGAGAGPRSFGVSAGALGDGVGLYVESSSGVTMRLNQTTLPVPVPAGSNQNIVPGCLVFNGTGLWFCYQSSGAPQNAKWVRLDSGPILLPTPRRVYDSRPNQLPAVGPKTPLPAETPRTIDLKAAGSGVPAGISAALLSVTATGTTTGVGGFLSVYASGAWPGTSNLNWSGPGQTVAVTTLSAVDGQSRVRVYAGSQTDVVIDVLAYFR